MPEKRSHGHRFGGSDLKALQRFESSGGSPLRSGDCFALQDAVAIRAKLRQCMGGGSRGPGIGIAQAEGELR